ncbi:hypothetical protein [uncultured Sphingomonas sp.]|uniref:hypothetical protein n=1 Tax=uncultured Sphingomonas sp. TaxID=158754 RepID=UPI00262C5AC2|nr:hypothetical protein [uncultured Sphingomonas sp.]
MPREIQWPAKYHMALPPDDKTARKHWAAQQASIDRPMGTRDPGLTQVAGVTDALTIIEQEAAGIPTPVFKARTATNLPDPIARSVSMIRGVTQKGVTDEQFLQKCETVEDITLHTLLFGQMPPDKKGGLALKLAKHLSDQQRDLEKLNIQRQNLEEKRVRNALELDKKMAKLRAFGIIEGKTLNNGPEGSGDV